MQNLAKRKTNAWQVKCKTMCQEEYSVMKQQGRFQMYSQHSVKSGLLPSHRPA